MDQKQVDPKIAFYDAQTQSANCFNAIYAQAVMMQNENAKINAELAELKAKKPK
jgi:hypothetical protein